MKIVLLFVINTLVLGYTYNSQRLQSVVDTAKMDTLVPSLPATAPQSSAPAAHNAPVSQTNQ